MIRILTLAATAAVLVAAPAMAADQIRINTTGKSADQLHADIHVAARKLCARAATNATFYHQEVERCVKQTVKTASAQASLTLAQR